MSATVEALASKIEKWLKLKGEVTIGHYKTVSCRSAALEIEENTFKRKNKERIDKFYERKLPLQTLTFTTDGGIKLQYKRLEEGKWSLEAMGTSSQLIYLNEGLIEIISELHI